MKKEKKKTPPLVAVVLSLFLLPPPHMHKHFSFPVHCLSPLQPVSPRSLLSTFSFPFRSCKHTPVSLLFLSLCQLLPNPTLPNPQIHPQTAQTNKRQEANGPR